MSQHVVWRAVFIIAMAMATRAGAEWKLAGQGDCPGPQSGGSAGELPEPERCAPAQAGKTALCFTQVCYPGCQYVDVLTAECPDGNENARIYTCVPEP